VIFYSIYHIVVGGLFAPLAHRLSYIYYAGEGDISKACQSFSAEALYIMPIALCVIY